MLRELKITKLNQAEKKRISAGSLPDCLGNCKHCQGSGSDENESDFENGISASGCG
jgi:hypothetical protein